MSFHAEVTRLFCAEELAHELAGPTHALELLVQEVEARTGGVDDELRSVAREEIDKLRGILRQLRRIEPPRFDSVSVDVTELCARIAAEVDCAMPPATLEPARVLVHPDFARLVAAPVAALVRQKVAEGGALVLSITAAPGQTHLHFCGARAEASFPLTTLPWETDNAVELDLMLARRIARGYGHRVRISAGASEQTHGTGLCLILAHEEPA